MPFYPVKLPSWATTLYNHYRSNYNDPLYEKNPPFFQLYVAIEVMYSVPICIWAIRGLISGTSRLDFELSVIRANKDT